MLSVTDLRRDTTFKDNGQIFKVLSYEHIKMGRGTATVRVKVKNLRTGSTTEKSFISNAKAEEIKLSKNELQFLYRDEEKAYFMHPLSFEQVAVPSNVVDKPELLKEGEKYVIAFYESEPLEIIFSPKMEFRVSDTGPATRGNSATNIYKDAVLENNIKVRVPLFIKVGDMITIDTKTLTYHEKARSS